MLAIENTRQTHGKLLSKPNVSSLMNSLATLNSLSLFSGQGHIEVPSWGGMLSREGRQYMEMAPSLALWLGLCPTLVVYALNMFGDALRDLFDPRLRGRRGQSRRRRETQTRLPLQTAQPLRLGRSSLPNRVAKPIQAHGLKASGRCLHNTRNLVAFFLGELRVVSHRCLSCLLL